MGNLKLVEVRATKVKAGFIDPMLLLRTESLPEGAGWLTELKIDGFRCVAFKTGGEVRLRSRNNNDFRERYPEIAASLAGLPNETVIDGEIVALDESGKPLSTFFKIAVHRRHRFFITFSM